MTGLNNRYVQLINEDIRLSVLRILCEDPAYSHNTAIIRVALAQLGHRISDERLTEQLGWLVEQELISSEESAGVVIVKLTNRGEEAVQGVVRIRGLARPRPE